MRKPILYFKKIDVINKDWCLIPALLVIAQPQKPRRNTNKSGLQFGKTSTGEDDAESITCYSRARFEVDFE